MEKPNKTLFGKEDNGIRSTSKSNQVSAAPQALWSNDKQAQGGQAGQSGREMRNDIHHWREALLSDTSEHR